MTGIFGALMIFFLALSGMPWSGYWGGKFQQLAAEMGMGYPAAAWDDVPVSDLCPSLAAARFLMTMSAVVLDA